MPSPSARDINAALLIAIMVLTLLSVSYIIFRIKMEDRMNLYVAPRFLKYLWSRSLKEYALGTTKLKPYRLSKKEEYKAGQGLQAYQLGGTLFLMAGKDISKSLHPHQRVMYVGSRNRFRLLHAGHAWTAVSTIATPDSQCLHPSSNLIWHSYTFYLQQTVSKLGHIWKAPIPDEIPYMISKPTYGDEANQFAETPQIGLLIHGLRSGVTAADFHNLYFHPEKFSEETLNPDFKDVPVDFVKAMFNLPQVLDPRIGV